MICLPHIACEHVELFIGNMTALMATMEWLVTYKKFQGKCEEALEVLANVTSI